MNPHDILALHIACLWLGLIAAHIRIEVLSRRADVATKRMDILSQRLDLARKIWTPESEEPEEPIKESEPLFWRVYRISAVILLAVVLPAIIILMAIMSL